MNFTLNDVPETFELRLSDEIVEAMDKLNRPWKYQKPDKQGKCQIWQAKDRFFKRLWGWSRFRKGHDNGAFIRHSDIQEILNKTNVSWWFLEENVIGLRKGTGNELKHQLPIEPDKWWAKLIGFYWSSGGHWHRQRDTNTETILRFNVDDAVIPMLHEIGKHIGDMPYTVTYVPVYGGPHKTRTLRSRVRQPILFSVPTLEVIKKFGIPDLPEQRPKGRGAAARNYNVTLPDWVKENDEYMHDFIEGYINGMRGHSMMHSCPRGIICQILIRFVGHKEEKVKCFAEAFRDWFNKHGVTGYFRKMPDNREKPTVRYEFIIHNKDGLFFLFKNFNIQRSDMRARLFLLREANENYGLFQLIRTLSTQQIVVLSLILETPSTLQEIKIHLRMRPKMVEDLVQSMKHILIFEDGKYHVEYSAFVQKQIAEKEREAEDLKQKISKLGRVLNYQCLNCGATCKDRRVCETCGSSEVVPIERNKLLRPLNLKMSKTLIAARKLRDSKK